MSETENQETNGTETNANGDVPEIELIIKEEYTFTNQILKEETKTETGFELELDYTINDYLKSSNEALMKNEKISDIASNELTLEDENKSAAQLEEFIKSEISTETVTHFCSDLSQDNAKLADVVAEACEGLFEEIENELDLQLQPAMTDTLQDSTKNIDKRRTKCDPNALQGAVTAVLEEDMSLGQAAKKYNVVKSTIWLRVSKHPNYRRHRKSNKALAEVIHSKFCDGLSLSEISRTLNVPKSTVSLHKERLKKSGLLPALGEDGNIIGSRNDIKQRLTQAYRGHRVNGMSVRFAAEFYSVPLTTLWRFIKKHRIEAKTNTATESIVPANEDEFDKKHETYEMEMKIEMDTNDENFFDESLLNAIFE